MFQHSLVAVRRRAVDTAVPFVDSMLSAAFFFYYLLPAYQVFLAVSPGYDDAILTGSLYS